MPSPGGGVQHRIYDLFASCVSSPPPLNFQALDIHACMHSLGLRFAFQFLSFCRLPLFNLTSKSPVISKLSQKKTVTGIQVQEWRPPGGQSLERETVQTSSFPCAAGPGGSPRSLRRPGPSRKPHCSRGPQPGIDLLPISR